MNMRKIIAVLAAVLLLCSAIPMGIMSVSAAAGDVVFDNNFDDGSNGGFERSYNENGYIVFDATTADWQNTYAYIGLKSNTMYKVTFSAKANVDASMNFKVNNNWSGDVVAESFGVTTDWQDYELIISVPSVDSTIVMFTSGYPASDAPIYCIDNLKIVETVDPALIGKVVNGDFSDNSGWTLGTGATIADGVLNLTNPNLWGEAALQSVPAKANTVYEITWKSQRISGTGAFNLFVMDAANVNLTKVAGQNWMNETSGNWVNNSFTINTGASEVIKLKFSTEANNPGTILIDDFKITEQKDPSFDGYITNGDFEIGKIAPWDNLWGSSTVELVAGHTGDYAIKVQTGMWNHVRQTGIAVKPNTDYVVKFYAKDAANVNLLVKDNGDSANIANIGFTAGSEWEAKTFNFNSGDNSTILISFMGATDGAYYTVDDITMYEKVEASNDGYIVNGTFETGDLAPWDNLWGSCPKAEVIKGGLDSNFALEIISGQWKHVRQTNIAVEANTDYKITAWAKNASGMSLLIKDGGDSKDIVNAGVSAGDEWTEFTAEFNTGDYTTIIFSLMGNGDEAYGTFDNIVMEKIVCEHEYDDCLDADCNLCGETREPGHNLTYFEAVVAANCQETSHDEYWYCENCGCYFGDAEASWQHNPGWLFTPGECVRPEGAADCAIVPCEVCGNDVYGYGEHDVLTCQGGVCSKCNAEIEGVGCQNYTTPACEDGVCYYCGGFVAGFGHENGAWAPCCDGECSYGCGLIYPATEDHVDADADDYCDNCWNHLACVDADSDGFCDVCWSEMPVPEIVYGDANGDGSVNARDAALLQQFVAGWNVDGLDETSADANGDGAVNARDAALLQQYVAGWDVTLGA